MSRKHPSYPPPSEELIEEVRRLLVGRSLTSLQQREHQTDFWFGDVEVGVEAQWEIEAGPSLVTGNGGRNLPSRLEQKRTERSASAALLGKTVAAVEIDQSGDLRLQFETGERMSVCVRPVGPQSWIVQLEDVSFAAEWGGLVERRPDKHGWSRIVRGG